MTVAMDFKKLNEKKLHTKKYLNEAVYLGSRQHFSESHQQELKIA